MVVCLLLRTGTCRLEFIEKLTPSMKEDSMDNYEGALGTGQSQRPSKTEDEFTKTVEDYTAAIPSSAFLGVAVGAMALSLALQIGGQGKWGNFIAQWVPTWLVIGLYNKLVKLEGHDQSDRGDGYSRYSS
jgi:hypothetical protein